MVVAGEAAQEMIGVCAASRQLRAQSTKFKVSPGPLANGAFLLSIGGSQTAR